MPVEMVVSFAPDGSIEGEPRIVDGARLKTDREFLLAAYTAARAVHGCSPFTLPSDSYKDWPQMALTFLPCIRIGDHPPRSSYFAPFYRARSLFCYSPGPAPHSLPWLPSHA